MKGRIRLYSSLFVALIITISTMSVRPAHADLTPGFDSILFDPAVDNSDYITVRSTPNLPKRGVHLGLYLDYARKPLELAAPLGTAIRGINDDMLIVNLQFSYGITDWASVGINIPLVAYNNFIDPTTAVRNQQINMGDIYIEGKFRLLNRDDHFLGIALIPFVTLPSGEAAVFTGAGGFTGGIKVALDTDIADRVKVALNVGWKIKQDATVRNARVDDQLLLSLGVNVKIVDRLFLIAEAGLESSYHDIFSDEVHNPLEVRGALRWMATDKLAVNVGGGAGLTLGVGAPDFRAFLGVTYDWDGCDCAEPVIETKKIAITEKVHFDFDSAKIKERSYGILDSVASVIQSNKFSSVTIEGHTDSSGSDSYNQSLSNRRANSVRQYLINKGISPSLLTAIGVGESRPIADNSTEEGRAANRRTEFIVQ